MKAIVTICTLIFLFFSLCKCNSKTESQNVSEFLSDISGDTLAMLLNKSIISGDTNSYNSIAAHYFIRNRFSEFLHYSLLMANKHNYNKAYYDVYLILKSPKWGEGILDSTTKSMSDHYLLESYRLGYRYAKSEIERNR